MISQPFHSALMVEIVLERAQDTGSTRLSEGRVTALFHHALHQEDQSGSWLFAIRFVDDAEITQLHERYLGDQTPTDIITFPYDPDDEMSGGDIVISVDTASRNAVDAGWDLTEELDFLMLHGLLHVLGWDDTSESHRAAMLDRQHELLESWRQANDVS